MRSRSLVASVVAVLFVPALAQAQATTLTSEVLVLTTSTSIPAYDQRRAIELQNLGPNTIYCSLGGAAPVSTKARAILAGGAWALDLGGGVPIKCISTVAQVTGAATIVTQVR